MKRAKKAKTNQLIQRVMQSPQWLKAREWGEPRPGHPEGKIDRHVHEQILPFIDRFYFEHPDYLDLVVLTYLHDIGKPDTRYENGNLVGDSHSLISARIAASLGAPDRLVQVIVSNDRPYTYWRKMLDKSGRWSKERWNEERRKQFREEFGRKELDLALLILFHRADNAYRSSDLQTVEGDPVLWFENALLEEGLSRKLPEPGKNERIRWKDAATVLSLDEIDLAYPWYKTESGLENELKRELRLNPLHPLFGVEAESIARRRDCDDVLFALKNYKQPLAVVHLTWASVELCKDWPDTALFSSYPDWIENCMYRDANELRAIWIDDALRPS